MAILSVGAVTLTAGLGFLAAPIIAASVAVFQNYSIPAFSIIRENIPFTLATQPKRIWIIASIAIAIIGACFLAMRYIKCRTDTEIATETISAQKENSIDWDSVIEIDIESDAKYQQQFDNFKKLLSHSTIDFCSYKKIYVAFLHDSNLNIVFDEESYHYSYVKQLPCLPDEALNLYCRGCC